MKHKQFWDVRQANSYLSDTIISVGTEPVVVTDLYSDGKLLMRYQALNDLETRKCIEVYDPDVDMNPVKLGLLATGKRKSRYNSSVFISRIPTRNWKIGLCGSNISVESLTALGQELYDIYHILSSKELRDTIVGNYLDLGDIRKRLTRDTQSIAFSRRFAVSSDSLYYKNYGVPVGVSNLSSYKGVPELFDQFFFLKEALEEDKSW